MDHLIDCDVMKGEFILVNLIVDTSALMPPEMATLAGEL